MIQMRSTDTLNGTLQTMNAPDEPIHLFHRSQELLSHKDHCSVIRPALLGEPTMTASYCCLSPGVGAEARGVRRPDVHDAELAPESPGVEPLTKLLGAVSTMLACSLRSGVRSPAAPGTSCGFVRPRYSMILRIRVSVGSGRRRGRGVPAHGFGVEVAVGAALAMIIFVAVGLVDDLFGNDFLGGVSLGGGEDSWAYFDDVLHGCAG